MNPAFDTYIQSLSGRDVTIIGAGVSNSPLIRMLCSAGARVTVRDRNPALPWEEWEDLGVFEERGRHFVELVETLRRSEVKD
ncbi:hypothetical protein [Paenibacillus arenilitoris]|uniref:hypothetical protein n=1 Tax=Paenibacillus arenilitoris TaxID=2772299 RepID=UPI001CC262C1|nr:hypothetical protein [Paenibacillus arenilitoris]